MMKEYENDIFKINISLKNVAKKLAKKPDLSSDGIAFGQDEIGKRRSLYEYMGDFRDFAD